MSDDILVFVVIVAVWATFGVLLGWLARRKNRHAVAWGLIGGFPYLALPAAIVLSLMPVLCPKCSAALTNEQWRTKTCPRCNAAPDSKAAPFGFRWRWIVLLAVAVGVIVLYSLSTSSVRRSVEAFCDSVVVGGDISGIEVRGRAAGLRVSNFPASVDADGRPQEAMIFATKSSPFFYVYNCFISHSGGKVTVKRAAGGAL
ncbi:MAG TPA: hypothetical protein VGR82_04760 [Methylomirabilota bacterium]|jgi:hypothetical protein|nr:hypothetical protein [Methylomirabilota bacterium]